MKVGSKLWNQWIIIVAILVCLVLVFILANFNAFYDYYAVNVWGPQLQKEMGFTAGPCDPSGLSDQKIFCITAVDPNGSFSKAGVHVGYVPVGYQHGFESGFYSQLQSARGTSATVVFIEVRNHNDYQRHKIQIDVPQ